MQLEKKENEKMNLTLGLTKNPKQFEGLDKMQINT